MQPLTEEEEFIKFKACLTVRELGEMMQKEYPNFPDKAMWITFGNLSPAEIDFMVKKHFTGWRDEIRTKHIIQRAQDKAVALVKQWQAEAFNKDWERLNRQQKQISFSPPPTPNQPINATHGVGEMNISASRNPIV